MKVITTVEEFYERLGESSVPGEMIPVTKEVMELIAKRKKKNVLETISTENLCGICGELLPHNHFHNGYLVIGCGAFPEPIVIDEEHKHIIIPWYLDFKMDESIGDYRLK